MNHFTNLTLICHFLFFFFDPFPFPRLSLSLSFSRSLLLSRFPFDPFFGNRQVIRAENTNCNVSRLVAFELQ